ncbi:MAG: hypothetical protein ACI9ZF_003256 [Bradyrhizobium sp.]|jgi:hypothetical protein
MEQVMRRSLVPVPVPVLVALPVVPVVLATPVTPVTSISVVSTVLPALVTPVPLIVWPSPSRQTPWRGNARDGRVQAFLRRPVAWH